MSYSFKYIVFICMALVMSLAQMSHSSQSATVKLQKNRCPDLIDLIKDLTPSVVSISTERRNSERDVQEKPSFQKFGNAHHSGKVIDNSLETDSIGSGFFCDRNGHIITNAHVVEGADRIFVTLATGKILDARIAAVHPRVDLALLKVAPPINIREVSLGKSDDVQVGEWVLAVGNPFGLGRTVTVGIVSGKGRFLGFGPDDNFIQTDASINPGNSGGPLFNMAGEVIGVNTAIISTGKGIGFSIPSSFISELIPSASESGGTRNGWIGVYIDEGEGTKSGSIGFRKPKGAVVDEVMTSTPAHQAGLKKGDLIIRADEKTVENGQDLSLIVSRSKPGQILRMTILRENKPRNVEVVVGNSPD